MQLKSVIEVFVKTSATFKFKTATNFKIFLIKMLFTDGYLLISICKWGICKDLCHFLSGGGEDHKVRIFSRVGTFVLEMLNQHFFQIFFEIFQNISGCWPSSCKIYMINILPKPFKPEPVHVEQLQILLKIHWQIQPQTPRHFLIPLWITLSRFANDPLSIIVTNISWLGGGQSGAPASGRQTSSAQDTF